MPHVKSQAWCRIRSKLESEMWSLQYKRSRNKHEIGKLAKEQRLIRAQIKALGELLANCPNKPETPQ